MPPLVTDTASAAGRAGWVARAGSPTGGQAFTGVIDGRRVDLTTAPDVYDGHRALLVELADHDPTLWLRSRALPVCRHSRTIHERDTVLGETPH